MPMGPYPMQITNIEARADTDRDGNPVTKVQYELRVCDPNSPHYGRKFWPKAFNPAIVPPRRGKDGKAIPASHHYNFLSKVLFGGDPIPQEFIDEYERTEGESLNKLLDPENPVQLVGMVLVENHKTDFELDENGQPRLDPRTNQLIKKKVNRLGDVSMAIEQYPPFKEPEVPLDPRNAGEDESKVCCWAGPDADGSESCDRIVRGFPKDDKGGWYSQEDWIAYQEGVFGPDTFYCSKHYKPMRNAIRAAAERRG